MEAVFPSEISGKGRMWFNIDRVICHRISILFKFMGDTSVSEVKSLSSSAETFGSNQDILTQILLRMPATPLLKFKLVSQQWLSFISVPAFSVHL